MEVKYNDIYSYIIFDDGYDIYKNGEPILTQREPYAHVFKHNGTYEENAIAQIEDMVSTDSEISNIEKTRSDLDYLALMMDVELPSEDSEKGE